MSSPADAGWHGGWRGGGWHGGWYGPGPGFIAGAIIGGALGAPYYPYGYYPYGYGYPAQYYGPGCVWRPMWNGYTWVQSCV
jgi:hypothetical protein